MKLSHHHPGGIQDEKTGDGATLLIVIPNRAEDSNSWLFGYPGAVKWLTSCVFRMTKSIKLYTVLLTLGKPLSLFKHSAKSSML